jgi:hypothetical protein
MHAADTKSNIICTWRDLLICGDVGQQTLITLYSVPPGRGSRVAQEEWVSRRGESHPPPLSGPDVTVSRHPAPTVRP